MPRKTVVYLSGPMTGIPDWNFPAFDQAACLLRSLGYRVINPADFGADPRFKWSDSIARDLSLLPCVNLIALLPGWENSGGSMLEVYVGKEMGIPSITIDRLREIGSSAQMRGNKTACDMVRGSATADFAPHE